MEWKKAALWVLGIFVGIDASAQFNVDHKSKQAQLSGAASVSKIYIAPAKALQTSTVISSRVTNFPPTVSGVQPAVQGKGGKVNVIGKHFNDSSTVTLGGVSAKTVAVALGESGDTIQVVVGDGASGNVVVTNKNGHSPDSLAIVFTFLQGAPTISTVSPQKAVGPSTITIIGTNFQGPVSVSFGGNNSINGTVISETAVTAVVPVGATGDTVTVTTAGGSATYPGSANPLDGNADLTVPDLGKGITIIPTPTFTYTSTKAQKWFSFTSSIWANTLGTDSTRQAVGNKFLLAQTSLFGFKVAANIRFTNSNSDVDVALYGEQNLLVKKVAFYDTSAKTNTSFNPLVLHTRIGLTGSLYNLLFIGVYGDILSVETENTNVSTFFQTGGTTVFAYPEVDAAGIFTLSKGSNQQIKAEFDMIINNKSANHFYSSGNSVIPYFKLGFVTAL